MSSYENSFIMSFIEITAMKINSRTIPMACTIPSCSGFTGFLLIASTSKNMNLPPCHILFQFYVANGKLSCLLYQRSADTFLGVPFNIASYSLLTMMVAQVCNLQPGDFVYTTGDTHIYLNHIEQVKLQLTREPRALPRMVINPDVKSIFDFKYEDFHIEGYDPWDHIKGVVSV